MKGHEFEKFLGDLFRGKGFYSLVTSKSKDFGCDLLIERDNRRISIQAKCYAEGQKVGVSAIQEVYSSLNYWKADEAWCITNREYTRSAIKLAEVNHVILIDRIRLVKILNEEDQILVLKEYTQNWFTLIRLLLSRDTFQWTEQSKKELSLYYNEMNLKQKVVFGMTIVLMLILCI